jgi:hypothetical protein
LFVGAELVELIPPFSHLIYEIGPVPTWILGIDPRLLWIRPNAVGRGDERRLGTVSTSANGRRSETEGIGPAQGVLVAISVDVVEQCRRCRLAGHNDAEGIRLDVAARLRIVVSQVVVEEPCLPVEVLARESE